MKLIRLLCPFVLFTLFSFSIQAQDTKLQTVQDEELEELPQNLEAEEEAMILERIKARQESARNEIKKEITQLEKGKIQTDEHLFYLENQFQKSSTEYNLQSRELQQLQLKRTKLLKEISQLLMDDNTEEEDWEEAPIEDSEKVRALNERIRKLDTQIAVMELAIPQQIEELEELESNIEENNEYADQLRILEQSNKDLLKKLEK
ncbi:MAG: hypothetical protein R8P61_27640 [Bacteroidia bacterium]|nr:hypothetical protein [Bacteroidia bacterium]